MSKDKTKAETAAAAETDTDLLGEIADLREKLGRVTLELEQLRARKGEKTPTKAIFADLAAFVRVLPPLPHEVEAARQILLRRLDALD